VRARRGLFPSQVLQPWGVSSLLFVLLLTLSVVVGPRAWLYPRLISLLTAGLGLALTAYLTRSEGSRPGPAPRPFVGLLLALALMVLLFLRPDAFLPLPPGIVRDGFAKLGVWMLLPVALLLLSGVSWNHLGLASLLRLPGRFRSLLFALLALLTVPAVANPRVLLASVQAPWWQVALALPVAYGCALLGEALPEEFFFRQLLQPRLQAYFRSPAPAIVLQALLYGLARNGSLLGQERLWPVAFGMAALEGSLFGLLYGLLRDRTGLLALPVLLHAWCATWAALPEVLSRLPFR